MSRAAEQAGEHQEMSAACINAVTLAIRDALLRATRGPADHLSHEILKPSRWQLVVGLVRQGSPGVRSVGCSIPVTDPGERTSDFAARAIR